MFGQKNACLTQCLVNTMFSQHNVWSPQCLVYAIFVLHYHGTIMWATVDWTISLFYAQFFDQMSVGQIVFDQK